jgi:hypothetical protein
MKERRRGTPFAIFFLLVLRIEQKYLQQCKFNCKAPSQTFLFINLKNILNLSFWRGREASKLKGTWQRDFLPLTHLTKSVKPLTPRPRPPCHLTVTLMHAALQNPRKTCFKKGYVEGKPPRFSEGNNRGKLWSLGGGGGQTLRLLQRVKRSRIQPRIIIFFQTKGNRRWNSAALKKGYYSSNTQY